MAPGVLENDDAGMARIGDALADLDRERAGWSPLRRFVGDYGINSIVAAHVRMLGQQAKGAALLDDGCGRGELLRAIAPAARVCIGIDPHTDSLAHAAQEISNLNNTILARADGFRLPFEDNTFDMVTSSEVIEHVPDPSAYLSEIHRVLKPGGVATVSTPNGWMHLVPFPWNIRKLLIKPHVYALDVYPERNWAAALPGHPAVRPGVLRRWCRDAGLDVLRHGVMVWYFWTPWRPVMRLLFGIERLGLPVRPAFAAVINTLEWLLARNTPMLRCFATRQIVLLGKK